MIVSLLPGYPIRSPLDHRMFAPPQSFSQLTATFFALQLQDIHHKPFTSLDHIIAFFSLRYLSLKIFPLKIASQ